jgi:hypothetical protein
LYYLIIFAGIWSLGNGLLHDVFVLLQRKPYDKELIRLLIDGHILMFAGVVFLLSANGVREKDALACYVAMTAAVFLLGYCALIFKILPSIATILINAAVLIALIFQLAFSKAI